MFCDIWIFIVDLMRNKIVKHMKRVKKSFDDAYGVMYDDRNREIYIVWSGKFKILSLESMIPVGKKYLFKFVKKINIEI